MANLEHDDLTSSQVHEPKHITINGTNASGRVITNSSSTSGESEYRRLSLSDIDDLDVWITGYEVDSTAAEDTMFIAPIDGTLEEVSLVISDALVTADNVYSIDINGTTPTPNSVTATQVGSASGDVFSVSLTSNNGVIAGDTITITSNGGNTDANVNVWFMLKFRSV